MAENIINILKTNNMTVAFVAQESGLDVAQVNETLKRPVATWSIQILNALADALGERPGELLDRIQDFDFHLHTDDDQLTIQHVQFQTPSSYQQVRFAVESNVLEGWEPTTTEVRRLKESAENPDDEILMEIEQLLAEREVALLQQQPKIKSFEDLQTINKFLFGWLYDWAGELRNYYISKAGFDFLEYGRFDNAIKYINDEIGRLNKKKQPTIEDYAALLNDLNYIHPFREGNGRSTKLFIQLIALHHGQVIDYPADNAEMIAGLNQSDVGIIAKTMALQKSAG